MFGPGVRHHQGAPPRSVYWKLALKKALQRAKPGQTWQAGRAWQWKNLVFPMGTCIFINCTKSDKSEKSGGLPVGRYTPSRNY